MGVTGQVKRGSIVYLSLDPTRGHEQGSFRPLLVVSDGFIQSNPGSTNAFIVPITTKDRSNVMKVPVPADIEVDGALVGKPEWTELSGFSIPNHARSVDLSARNAVVIGEVDPQSDFYLRSVTIVRAILA
ncbi:type II toxin-antitoxin system PemK/MazF family toxin [Micrococcus luteus]|nr:type II toxin-antitoxin system PemK/MazF family toxin [Micrococcus luteus]